MTLLHMLRRSNKSNKAKAHHLNIKQQAKTAKGFVSQTLLTEPI